MPGVGATDVDPEAGVSDFLLRLFWREPLRPLLILLPLMLAGLARQRRHKLASYADRHLLPWAVAARVSGNGFSLRSVLTWTAWCLLAIAAAGPRTPLVQPADALRNAANRHHLTLMVALDISASMAATGYLAASFDPRPSGVVRLVQAIAWRAGRIACVRRRSRHPAAAHGRRAVVECR
jgi:hypothetical protein